MKTFISWSGDYSREVAFLFSKWIKDVIQASNPFVSQTNIEPGSNWLDKINDGLKTSVGIICLTKSNKNNPWLLFEAGALSKSIDSAESRVCPLLINLTPKDVEQPLAQFHMVSANRKDILTLVHLINSRLDADRRIDKADLEASFEKWWPDFEKGLQDIANSYPEDAKAPERTEENILGEILENTRFMSQGIRNLENVTFAELERKHRDERVNVRSIKGSTKYVRLLENKVSDLMNQGVSEEEIFRRLQGESYPDQLIYETVAQRFGHPVR